MDLNKVLICGRVTNAPELRRTAGGTSVTTFSVATNHVSKDKNGNRKEETEFHNIVAWGRTAEVASQFLTKGALTLIEGRLQTRSWEDKQGGKRKSTEIICERLQLGPRPGSGARTAAPADNSTAAAPAQPAPATSDASLPVINLDEEPEQPGAGDDQIPF